MFSWYQKRECTFIIIAIIAVTGEIERSAAAWSQTSIDIPEEPHSAACDAMSVRTLWGAGRERVWGLCWDGAGAGGIGCGYGYGWDADMKFSQLVN